MYEKRFGAVAVSLAAGVGESTLRSWFDRGLIPVAAGDRFVTGRGIPRDIDFHTALQIGIAAELVRLGVGARRACRLALSFSDTSNGDRKPGALFDDDKTLLVVVPRLESGQVVRAGELPALIDRLTAASFAVVDVTEIHQTISASLMTLSPYATRS